jgi:hypothetical protein
VVGWIGLSIWAASCNGPSNSAGPDIPETKEATHSFYIENTGGLIYSSDFEQQGITPGKRVFVFTNYWEARGKDFVFVDDGIIIDENIFGEITVKRR